MLDLATPLSRAGATAGGALGTGAHWLGQILEPLDYPRQALWNLGGKLAEGDWKAALPGLLGAGAGLAALPFLGPGAALLAGSVAGGLGQGIGKSVDEERFAAPTPSHLVEALGIDPGSTGGALASFGAGLAGDPLMYTGLLGGARAGAKYGSALEDVARARGPYFPGGAEKMEAALASPAAGMRPDKVQRASQRMQSLLQDPHSEYLLRELPPGSQVLGTGEEATAFLGPQGHVVRIAGGPDTLDVSRAMQRTIGAPGPAPGIPEVLQPGRDVAIGPYRVQHVPLAEMRRGPLTDPGQSALLEELRLAASELEAAAGARGYAATDLHTGNIGKLGPSRYVIADPGGVVPGGVRSPAVAASGAEMGAVESATGSSPLRGFSDFGGTGTGGRTGGKASGASGLSAIEDQLGAEAALRGRGRASASGSASADSELEALLGLGSDRPSFSLGSQDVISQGVPGASGPLNVPAEPGPLQRILLRLLGADRGVQAELADALARSRATSGLELPQIPGRVRAQLLRDEAITPQFRRRANGTPA